MKNLDYYYKILGLTPPVSTGAIKTAYRRLAKVHHPDRFAANSPQQKQAVREFIQITEAYEVLRSVLHIDDCGSVPKTTTVVTTPPSPATYYALGTLHAENEDFQDAISAFSQSIRIDPTFLKAYQYRGFIYSKLGYENRAEADLRKAKEIELAQSVSPKESKQASSCLSQETSRVSQPEEAPSESWQIRTCIQAHARAIHCLAISPRGNCIASGGDDRQIKLWDLDLPSVKLLTALKETESVSGLSFSPDGHNLYSCSRNCALRQWDLLALKPRPLSNRKTQHDDVLTALALSRDGKILATGSKDRTIKLWFLDSGDRGKPLTLKGYGSEITSIVISPDGQLLASAGLERNIRLRSLTTGKLLRSLNNESGAFALAINSNASILAVGSANHKIHLWNLHTGEFLGQLTGHQDGVTALAFSGSGLELISGSLDRRLKIWDVEKKCELATLIGHGDAISSLLLSPDDQFLFSASIDGKIFSWQRPG